MDLPVNCQPLLQKTESDSDTEGDSESPQYDDADDTPGTSKDEDCHIKMGNPRDR